MKKKLLALGILASAIGAQAGIILNDSFDYSGPSPAPAVDIVGAPGSQWQANSGATTMQVTNNQLLVTSLRAQDIYRAWQSGPSTYLSNSAAVLYSSYTLHCTFLPSGASTYFSHFGGTNCFTSSAATITGHRCRVESSITNSAGVNADTGNWYLGILNSAVSGQVPTYWPTQLDTNTTYTIVTRYVVASGESTLWVNPSAETDTSITNTTPGGLPYDWQAGYQGVQWPNSGPINISFYDFRQASGEGDQRIDNLKVGTRFADVAGANTAPLIGVPGPQNTPMNTTIGPLPVTVQDAETPASELHLTASSSNTGLVPNGNISLGSDVGGTNRSLTLTPATGQQGATTITLVVDDSVNFTTNSFLLTVGAPTVGSISNQLTSFNTATPAIPFTVGDSEGDALTVTAASSNPTLVPPGNIHVGVAVPNVSSNVVVTPASGQNGVATITLTVSDGHTSVSTSFFLTVSPAPIGLVYSEDWAYPDGPLYLATGGSGAPWTPVSVPTGETGDEVQVSNQLCLLVYTNGVDMGAPFMGSAQYYGSNGVVVYTSFTVDCSYLPSTSGDYFFHLSASATDTSGFHDKIFANTANAAAGKFRYGIANSATAPAQVQFPRDLITNATYAVVTRYVASTGESKLWVNPVNAQSPSVTSADNPATSTIGGVALRQPSCCIGNLAIGPMKVGTSFSDVWTAPAPPHLDAATDGSGNLILNWSNPLFVLQSAANVAGPYADIAPSGPYTNSISGQQYFRLKY
ncbi:MAG TPA: hypothetical protein VMU04_07060 [Candidatus Acidoferrum sp.]|nr:hypothetical protein [Candidatus Acidoferrum sp.]